MNKFTTSIPTKARDIIQNALQNKRYKLLEPESKELIAAFGITTARHTVTASVKEAIQAATSIGYPIVLKIVSPDISHKTDVGGVKVGIKDNEGIKAAYEEIMKNVNMKMPDARIEGILVEEMATPSTEVIIGGLRDPQFGPAVMFGLGGIFVEVYKDVSFRIAPLEEYDAIDMIHEIKGSKILKGFRNTESLDITSVAQTILKVSNIMVSLEEIKEIDLNPVLVYPKGVKAVDARIILSRL
ncbi:MAG: acetate--CoA ligase family protein [Planctomycetes bacterium]|uniref:acetate--CoA ligase family protein n=1 Tax=Candidatus Wunengus californicus TaxID=3367619 RepID=UPI004027CD49|nr:acetate--CoA ligase family protein [Planctomycetota bacterium]MBI4222884.1 acetate--CoA ligase family protein [Planctomycetota bacterium]